MLFECPTCNEPVDAVEPDEMNEDGVEFTVGSGGEILGATPTTAYRYHLAPCGHTLIGTTETA